MDRGVRELLMRGVKGFHPDTGSAFDQTMRLVARRRQRRRVGSAIFAMILVSLTFLGVWTVFRQSGGPATGKESPADVSGTVAPRLYLASDGELQILDPEAERIERVPVPAMSPGDPPFRLVRRGNTFVFFGGDATYSFDSPTSLNVHRLGSSRFFVPSGVDDRVWLALADPKNRYVTSAVEEVTVEGDVTVSRTPIPQDKALVGAVNEGLILQPPVGGLEVWNPNARHVTNQVPGAFLVAAQESMLASCDTPCDTIHVANLASEDQVTVPVPKGVEAFDVGTGAFSPDGTSLAVPGRVQAGVRSRRVLVLADLGARAAAVVRESDVPGPYAFVAWSSSGDRVFLAGGEPPEQRVIDYRVSDETARALDIDAGPFYGIAST